VGLGEPKLPLFLATNEVSLGGHKRLGVVSGICLRRFS
jgi:hypothetical protein